MYISLPKEVSVKSITKLGVKWYKYTAKIAPVKLNIVGSNLIIGSNENSASIKLILFGWIKTELPKKSEPTPTKKSDAKYPKNILNKPNVNNGIITAKFASWEFK